MTCVVVKNKTKVEAQGKTKKWFFEVVLDESCLIEKGLPKCVIELGMT